MSLRKKISKKGAQIIDILMKPIIFEFPFFIMFFFLISLSPFKYLTSCIISLNFEPIALSDLARAMAISYFLSVIIFITKSKVLKALLYILGLGLFSLNVFLWFVFHLIIGPQIITLIVETNTHEAFEFVYTYVFSGKGVASMFVVALAIAVITFVEKRWNTIDVKHFVHYNKLLNAISIFLMFFIIFGFSNFDVYYRIAKSKTMDDLGIGDPFPFDAVTSMVFSLNSIRTTNIEMNKAIRDSELCTKGNIEENDSINAIFVIGESYIKSHSDLYGYPLETCPNLDREQSNGNLFVFNNVISPANYTSVVLKNLMCCNSVGNGEKWYDYPFFPTIFKKSGFNVYYWDIQRTDDSQGLWVYSLNSFLFNDTMIKISYDNISRKDFDYDDQLVQDYEKTIKRTGKYNLMIFHLWGQHVDAVKRFPHTKQFERFTYKEEKQKAPYLTVNKRKDIANYDNATYYNDYVLNHIINLYGNKNTVLVYLSDHGEEIYDYRDSKGRINAASNQLANYLKYQFDVPFMIWCSDKYKETHPSIIKEIRAALNKPFMTDNVCNLLFHLSGLKTRYYRSQYDLISPKYNKFGDRILYNGINYDRVTR